MSDDTSEKAILVLARRDHAEAMRVAAGLTIFGHRVGLVFMTEPGTYVPGVSAIWTPGAML